MNKQNCRIWADENPRVIQQQALHIQKVAVWCALWSKGVIDPYFFENAAGNAITVNSGRYRNMISDYLWNQIVDVGLECLFLTKLRNQQHNLSENRLTEKKVW